MNPITGRLFDRFGARWLTIIGFFILTITTFMFINLSTETSFTYLAVTNGIRMLSISMVMMPVTTAGLNILPTRLIPHGSAVNNTFRQVSGFSHYHPLLILLLLHIFTIIKKKKCSFVRIMVYWYITRNFSI